MKSDTGIAIAVIGVLAWLFWPKKVRAAPGATGIDTTGPAVFKLQEPALPGLPEPEANLVAYLPTPTDVSPADASWRATLAEDAEYHITHAYELFATPYSPENAEYGSRWGAAFAYYQHLVGHPVTGQEVLNWLRFGNIDDQQAYTGQANLIPGY